MFYKNQEFKNNIFVFPNIKNKTKFTNSNEIFSLMTSFLHINQIHSSTVLYQLCFNLHCFPLPHFSLTSSAHTYCWKDSPDINATCYNYTTTYALYVQQFSGICACLPQPFVKTLSEVLMDV